MGAYERITNDKQFDGIVRNAHEARYRIASGYTDETSTVLDFACGIGYGRKFLKGHWIGVDKIGGKGVIQADLNIWKPDFSFDVAVCFETIEHIQNYQNIIDICKMAKEWIVLSTPNIPTKHENEHHVNDFTEEQIKGWFKDWELYGDFIQEHIYSVLIFKKL